MATCRVFYKLTRGLSTVTLRDASSTYISSSIEKNPLLLIIRGCKKLQLDINMLIGTIPGGIRAMYLLCLARNQLSGSIPERTVAAVIAQAIEAAISFRCDTIR